MVRAKLSLDKLAVVPDRPYRGAAVVVLVEDAAAAAFVVFVADDQALVVLVRIVIAGHDLAARCQFGHEVDLCANHRSLPSLMAGEFRAADPRLAGRADHDARVPPPFCTAIISGRLALRPLLFCPRTGRGHQAEPGRDGWLPAGLGQVEAGM